MSRKQPNSYGRKSKTSTKDGNVSSASKRRVVNALVGNPGTGSGTKYDNSIQRVYRSENKHSYKDCMERLEYLYDKDAILQQIVQDPINDSLSNWRETSVEMKSLEDKLDYQRIFMEAGIFARRNGSSLIIPILEIDGKKVALTTSLERAIEMGATVRRLMVVSHFEEDENLIKDTFSFYHGRPVRYKIGEKKISVHHSRAIPVYANLQKTSVFTGIEEYLSAFQLGRQDVSRAVQEANFLVLSTDFAALQQIVDDGNIVSGEDQDLYDFISDRLRNLRDNANNNNAYAIDKELEALTNIQKANIKDMGSAVDQMAQFLAGASNIPMSKLFAKTQNGLGGASQTDLQNYVIFLEGMRFMVLQPSLVELDKFMREIDASLNISYEWNPVVSEQYIVNEQNAEVVEVVE